MSFLRKMMLFGKNFIGEDEDVNVNDKSLNVSDFNLLIAEGKITGKKVIHKFGKNPLVSTSVYDAIWNGGGEYTGFNATDAEIVSVASSSPDDSILGIGLRKIRLYGLDANGLEQTEDIELNGTTPVLTTKEFIRLDRMRGLESGGGTFGANLGEITAKQSITTTNIFAVLPIGYNSTMIAAYTIPAGKKGYLLGRGAAITNKKAAIIDVRMKAKTPGSIFTTQGEAALNSVGTGYVYRMFRIPPMYPPMTDIFVEATSSADVAVAGFFDILLVDE